MSRSKNQKKCLICQTEFIDQTKSGNRLICSSSNCYKKRAKLYRSKRSKEELATNQKSFRANNPNYHKEWEKANRDRVRKWHREYVSSRLKVDPDFKLAHNMRCRIRRAIKHNKPALEVVGCSTRELKQHLEKQFTAGMTWENYGKWHIDHIKPLASYDLSLESEVKRACHYTNLQPLWAYENRVKGAKDVTLYQVKSETDNL